MAHRKYMSGRHPKNHMLAEVKASEAYLPQRHKSFAFSQKQEFHCPHCPKWFASDAEFKAHWKELHLTRKRY